ncbi:DUF2313 domain-containing protein [Peptostreptococcus anaerobius]|uniref:putative phage tail protein n=1 Tax=Peptostreptococcus anaerobius TaxID=1261 RepID=UPI00232EE053|nr:putative phage tail protein [Peptostreptococcus anaerobius]MDB8821762.1 DUF2313 domain-containing protein [Peptostreptococcus anaerobius]MDB8826391.1 DUF2313 domain-containing protein [Peptostreptococcus anaerobius]MDB8828196.1 DUF2313 domain-containing protein [Peptostreptococcus anaerobius]MDB8829943.1 DUF2313 domain-containing protein [Peptostreptococcus anaerobius]MDB8831868.1 DUF2313 domain-containing protein [Peptostreptococcus anaerobius]
MIVEDNLFKDFFINTVEYDINKMMPQICRNRIDKAYHDALNNEIRLVQMAVIDTFKQLFVLHATWGLSEWEKLAGLPESPELDEVTRRGNVMAAFRSMGVTNVERIKDVCKAYTSGDVDVREIPSEYRYIVEFISMIGIPPRIDQVKKMIDLVNPAHLSWDFKYKYNTWGDLLNTGKTAGEILASGKSVKQLREEELTW